MERKAGHLGGRSDDLAGLNPYKKALFSVSHVSLLSFKENITTR